MTEEDLYYIYSFEHGAWWKPNKNGYTDSLDKAGKYTKEEAYKMCAFANWVSLEEVPVAVAYFEYQKTNDFLNKK